MIFAEKAQMHRVNYYIRPKCMIQQKRPAGILNLHAFLHCSACHLVSNTDFGLFSSAATLYTVPTLLLMKSSLSPFSSRHGPSVHCIHLGVVPAKLRWYYPQALYQFLRPLDKYNAESAQRLLSEYLITATLLQTGQTA